MIIKRAEKMGFCFGVSGAVNLCEKIIKKNNSLFENIYILGMLVHNKNVVNELVLKGFKILLEEDLLNGKINLSPKDLVVIRAHGTTKEIYNILKKSNCKLYDATCIFVEKIRKALIEAEEKGNEILFIGDKFHPEVKGIISFGKNIKIFASYEEFINFKIDEKVSYTLLTQTTFNKEIFFKIKDYIVVNFKNIEIYSKICGATYERQRAVEKLASEVELVLVVGDKTSSNSKKLLELSKNINENSHLIEDKSQLDLNWFKGISMVGITAGASTPEKIIIEIEKYIRGNLDDKHGL
ncbi:4-hydroxy-3-methylbut-2-enyl diphosphate reductase [Fusobacterium perfoetens]|uniref:4-hydroxy-3-methylbut-2-enyl diphosphate reductase n=1 Tax=Fusobacterium perfoetens TaxID=852 RepID=UPI000486EA8D|nr:4-hydroxy-3-methylbut-2-enyl diphosphate reductase [Fusobacterium perfoetens]MCI6153006.1 4-hydroxy-3-methylbut-2-enyl diphosphate reductase [Fusobacterium perfoetens]MDY3237403.1 4-hydroxy-3-methylbut-2-enyl diphosphate reductase [Fusobacterium perfoetens]